MGDCDAAAIIALACLIFATLIDGVGTGVVCPDGYDTTGVTTGVTLTEHEVIGILLVIPGPAGRVGITLPVARIFCCSMNSRCNA